MGGPVGGSLEVVARRRGRPGAVTASLSRCLAAQVRYVPSSSPVGAAGAELRRKELYPKPCARRQTRPTWCRRAPCTLEEGEVLRKIRRQGPRRNDAVGSAAGQVPAAPTFRQAPQRRISGGGIGVSQGPAQVGPVRDEVGARLNGRPSRIPTGLRGLRQEPRRILVVGTPGDLAGAQVPLDVTPGRKRIAGGRALERRSAPGATCGQFGVRDASTTVAEELRQLTQLGDPASDGASGRPGRATSSRSRCRDRQRRSAAVAANRSCRPCRH